MSQAAALPKKMPPEVQEKIAQYGNGLIAQWEPQQALLDHPVRSISSTCLVSVANERQAMGWYLSHGGHNSTLETIMAGVPT